MKQRRPKGCTNSSGSGTGHSPIGKHEAYGGGPSTGMIRVSTLIEHLPTADTCDSKYRTNCGRDRPPHGTRVALSSRPRWTITVTPPRFARPLCANVLLIAAMLSPIALARPADALDGRWTAISPPSGRYGHTAVYDSLRDRMIIFGAWDGGRRNDVWALSMSDPPVWSRLTPRGTPPTPRLSHAAIYDAAHDRMVIFGGDDRYPCNDTWALSSREHRLGRDWRPRDRRLPP